MSCATLLVDMTNTYSPAETIQRQIARVERAQAVLRARMTRLKFLIEASLADEAWEEQLLPFGLHPPQQREH